MKLLRVVLRQPASLFKGGCFPQKAGRRVRVSLLFFAIYRKKVPGKIPIPFPVQKERLDGFSTRRVRFANSLFYVPFFSAKSRTKSSSLSAVFCNIQKKGTGENPDTFPGAEGETRRVFDPSCSLCEQFILCPFFLRKKPDEEFESLCCFLQYTEKRYRGKSRYLSWRRRRDSNSRAGYPTYALSRGASSPT